MELMVHAVDLAYFNLLAVYHAIVWKADFKSLLKTLTI